MVTKKYIHTAIDTCGYTVTEEVKSSENIRKTARYLSGLKSLERIDLIGYHGFGKVKYTQLGKDSFLQDVRSPSEGELKDISKVFERCGLKVQIGG